MQNFIIYGQESVMVETKIKEVLEDLNLDIEIEYFNIKDDGINQILGVLNTPTFLSPTKCVVIKNCEDIFNVETKYYKYFLQYLANPASFTVLFMWFKKIDNSLFTDIKKLAIYYELIEKKEDIVTFINKYLANNEFIINDDALDYIVSYGEDLSLLKNILDELICYKIDTKTIAKEDIEALLEAPLEDNVYELCNAVIKRDGIKAYNIYNDLLKFNVVPTYLLGLIINKFQEIYNNNILVNNGYTQNDIAQINNVKLGRAYYMLQEAKNISTNSLKKTLKQLNELEYGIKKGTLNQKVAFSSYLLSL